MQDSKKTQIPRRAFLQGATAAVGTTLIGLSPASSLAAGLQKGGSINGGIDNSVAIAYWDGLRFVPAGELPNGDATLQMVNIGLHGFGPSASLRGIDANAFVPMGKSTQRVPFCAWVASSGCDGTRFTMTVDQAQGVLLTARLTSGKISSVTDCQFVTGSNGGFKLREGVYVIAPGSVNWSLYTYEAGNTEAPLMGPNGPVSTMQYVVMVVNRA